MKVNYFIKNVYGNPLIYLVTEGVGGVILDIIGQKTISKSQMEKFEKLGVEFVRVFEPEQ